jgi:hypothetical protein
MLTSSRIFKHLPAILLTLGLVAWFQEIFSIEWSFPYCSSQLDGPASAVWGMPLPYVRWSTVSSMEYFWMPTILILNLGLLFAVSFPFVSWVLQMVERRASGPHVGKRSREVWEMQNGHVSTPGLPKRALSIRVAATVVGLFLIMGFVALTTLMIQTGIYKITVENIAHEDYESYSDFRPVRIGFKTLGYQCTPSEFWFPKK